MIVYTDIQKAAIVSMIIEMINADAEVTVEEFNETKLINVELRVDNDIFLVGREMKMNTALEIVRRMNDVKKIHTAQLLTRIIDADGRVRDEEIALLNSICQQVGLDKILIDKQ